MTAPQDSKACCLAFSERAVITGSNLRFSQLVRGVGGVRGVVLCTTRDGREVIALASEWPRVDASRLTDGSHGDGNNDQPRLAKDCALQVALSG